MYISDLKLVNFRNYKNERISLTDGVNILVGANAQGKTNFLESVYYCSKGSSFKSTSDKDIVKKGEEFFTLDAQIIKQNRRKLIHIQAGNEKIIKINGLEIDRLDDIKNQFELVYFLPDHLRIVKDGPDLRRELVDEAIENIRPSFRSLTRTYNKVLRERNAKLKKKSKYFKEEINALTIQLIDLGAKISLYRNSYIEVLRQRSGPIHHDLSLAREELDLRYKSSISEMEDREDARKKLAELFARTLEEDIERGYTTKGPHRDDIGIYINDMDIKKYASQGQQRSAILSIKLAEIDIIKDNAYISPILLLDDVFSELDRSRREKLIQSIRGVQALITTNDINFSLGQDTNILKVKEGKIYQC